MYCLSKWMNECQWKPTSNNFSSLNHLKLYTFSRKKGHPQKNTEKLLSSRLWKVSASSARFSVHCTNAHICILHIFSIYLSLFFFLSWVIFFRMFHMPLYHLLIGLPWASLLSTWFQFCWNSCPLVCVFFGYRACPLSFAFRFSLATFFMFLCANIMFVLWVPMFGPMK